MSPVKVWQLLYSFFVSQHIDSSSYRIAPGLGSRRVQREGVGLLTPSQIDEEIRLDDSNAFIIHDRDGLDCQTAHFFSANQYKQFHWLAIGTRRLDRTPDSWSFLAEALASEGGLYLAAFDSAQYHSWQKCRDIRHYERKFGSTRGFPQVNQGSPPTTKAVLDISNNPGRTTEINGFPAYVAANMWLGPTFWEHAPCTKEEVLASDLFIEKKDTPHYLYLKGWPEPFTRPDGEQGRVQQKLWRLLFHQDCEWPPGSGGISDTPVGGPPELMPQ